MRVSLFNSISFKSIPIYNVKLRQNQDDGTYNEVPATFSKLDNQDKNDISRAEAILEKWPFVNYADYIAKDFIKSANPEVLKKYEAEEIKNYDFYVIEEKGDKENKEIYSIIEFDKSDNVIELLESNPQNVYYGIKGAGEVMLWGIAKRNQSFSLYSAESAVNFYRTMGLDEKEDFYGSFYLPAERTDNFLHRIERKYNFET